MPTPNQSYSGRRRKGEMANIWEVVSALANALQDARNELVSLMHTSKSDPLRALSSLRSPLRLSGGQRCRDQCREAIRNLHSAHAYGAFGASSEYGVTPRRSSATAGRRCSHPLHRIGAEARTLLSARRVHPSGVVKGCRMSQPPAARVDRATCVRFGSWKGQTAGSCLHDSSPDPQRRCMAKQFASLLAHEAHHEQRQRRKAEELVLRDKRSSWSRF